MLFVALLLCAAAVVARETYIIDGNDADIAGYPYMGSYRNELGVHVCGITLVQRNWALTAAHCAGNSEFTTEWGTSVLGSGTVINVRNVTRHPDFGEGNATRNNDISVVRLDSLAFGTNIVPIAMAGYRLDNTPGGNILGWGETCDGCDTSQVLQHVLIPVINTCAVQWGSQYNNTAHICVFNGEAGGCNRDGGGPLVADNALHGLASFTAPNCNVSYPTVYTRMFTYREFVCNQTNGQALGC